MMMIMMMMMMIIMIIMIITFIMIIIIDWFRQFLYILPSRARAFLRMYTVPSIAVIVIIIILEEVK